jgi:REG-2-like HAD superfamily hydrolase
MPWTESKLRYVGDARPFWRHIVSHATGCTSEPMFEDIYAHYASASAWKLSDGVVPALTQLKDNGLKLAVVSNFDTRLRPILHELGVTHLFDEIIVSAEVGVEKPNPMIFEIALSRLQVDADNAVHVGDDRRNDIWGARDARVEAWLWGVDVESFDEVVERVLQGRGASEEARAVAL